MGDSKRTTKTGPHVEGRTHDPDLGDRERVHKPITDDVGTTEATKDGHNPTPPLSSGRGVAGTTASRGVERTFIAPLNKGAIRIENDLLDGEGVCD
jgi:hypothetical protein